jgi:signal transduction histidine kinase
MFERLDRGSSGSGIGLAVCRRILTAHGSTIWATGNELGGTTFHFTLPHQARTT